MATFAYWTLRFFARGPSGGMNPLSSSATSAKFRLDIAKVWVEFGLDAFPHKVSYVLKRGNPASFSDIRHHPFPFVYEIVRKTHDNSSQVIVGVYICIIIEAVHDGKAIDDILPILSPIVSLFTTALAITLGWPNCSFRHFRAVAYIMPFDPKLEIAWSASPLRSMCN